MHMSDAIVENYLAKCDKVNPDGSTCEDIERDLTEPIAELERSLVAAQAALRDARSYVEAVAMNAGSPAKRKNYMGCVHRIDAALTPTGRGTR
jgi:hypothetical protein